jgi:hypothetical protein
VPVQLRDGSRSLPLALPHRYDRSIHWADFELEWKQGGAVKFIGLQANACVLTVRGFGRDGSNTQEVMPVAAKELDLGNGKRLFVLRTVTLKQGQGSRQADRVTKIGKEFPLDRPNNITHVRWPTQPEMNLLGQKWYEQARKMEAGDMYLPNGFKRKQPSGEVLVMNPKEDPFGYFSLVRTALNEIATANFASYLAKDYLRYAAPLVVAREFPGYEKGKASSATKAGSDALIDALKIAGSFIAHEALNLPPRDGPTPPELVLLDMPSPLLAKLGLKVGGNSTPSGSKVKKKPSGSGSGGSGSTSRGSGSGTETKTGGGSKAAAAKKPATTPKKPAAAAGPAVVTQAAQISQLKAAVEQEQKARASDRVTAAAKLEATEAKVASLTRDVRQLRGELEHVHNKWRAPYMHNETELQRLVADGLLSSDKRTAAAAKVVKVAKRPLGDDAMESASQPPLTRQRSSTPPRRHEE